MAKRRFNQDENMADIAAYAATPMEKPATPVAVNEETPTNSEIITQNSELKKTGRPKKTRKIEGGAPVTVFFDQETKSKLMLAKVAHKIEMKDLIAGATYMFLEKYYHDGQISLVGQDELEKALDRFYGSY